MTAKNRIKFPPAHNRHTATLTGMYVEMHESSYLKIRTSSSWVSHGWPNPVTAAKRYGSRVGTRAWGAADHTSKQAGEQVLEQTAQQTDCGHPTGVGWRRGRTLAAMCSGVRPIESVSPTCARTNNPDHGTAGEKGEGQWRVRGDILVRPASSSLKHAREVSVHATPLCLLLDVGTTRW